MKLKFLNKTKGEQLINCVFVIRKTIDGNLYLDSIYNNFLRVDDSKGAYSYLQVVNMKNLRVRQEGTIVLRKYKSGKNMIDALNKFLQIY
tara:strand:- start:34 stop:303 length:270 start_codon:yes stop_codon:yes gene_type:complete